MRDNEDGDSQETVTCTSPDLPWAVLVFSNFLPTLL